MSQYKVKEGDTLWKIAEKLLGNGSRYSEIQRANNLTSDVIHSGQVLKIPGRGHNTTNHGATSHGATSHGAASHGATNHGATNHGATNHGATSISEDEFDNALTSNGYPVQRQKYDDFIQSCNDGKIRTKGEAAMYLATLLHESNGLSVTEESYNPKSIEKYGRYIGRGYIQLSSEANYRAASNYLRKDYVKHPENVSDDPHAWNVSAWYWKDQVHQHVNDGFRATVTYGIRPLQPHFPNREMIYENVCQAFGVTPQL